MNVHQIFESAMPKKPLTKWQKIKKFLSDPLGKKAKREAEENAKSLELNKQFFNHLLNYNDPQKDKASPELRMAYHEYMAPGADARRKRLEEEKLKLTALLSQGIDMTAKESVPEELKKEVYTPVFMVKWKKNLEETLTKIMIAPDEADQKGTNLNNALTFYQGMLQDFMNKASQEEKEGINVGIDNKMYNPYQYINELKKKSK